jgi:Terminase large subunit, T4likevirus-type, N-terminal
MNAAQELLSLYEKLPPKEQAELDADVSAILGNDKWFAQEGPQTEAYFSEADELLFGGSAGGGKSDLLIGYALNEAANGVIFRNGLGNVRDLESRAISVLGGRDGFNSQFHAFDLGDARSLEFGSLEQPGSEQNWQGRRRDFIGFDEATQQMKERVQFVMGWAGSAKAGTKTRVIYATNPPLSDQGNWIITWFAPWLDPMFPNKATAGELRWFVNNKEGDPIWVEGAGQFDRGDGVISTAKSRTFIPSSLSDNAFLRDTGYRSQIESLPEPMRSALLNGNFMAARSDHGFQIIPSDWIKAAQARWTERGSSRAMIAMGVDIAQGGKDRTVLARLHADNWFNMPVSVDGINTKDGPAVAGLAVQNQRNGAPIALDMTGGWGGDARTQLTQSEVDVVPLNYSSASGSCDPNSKIFYYNLRAEMYWSFRLALNPNSGENIALPPDQKLLAEATSSRWELRGGKIIVESKDDVKKRLGSSPDIWDAYVMAWHIRGRGLRKQVERRGGPHWAQSAQEADPFAVEGM